MPREAVPSSNPGSPTDPPHELRMEVGWQKDTHMQVGLRVSSGTLFDMLAGSAPVRQHVGAELVALLADPESELSQALRRTELAGDGDAKCEAETHAGQQVIDILSRCTQAFNESIWWTPTRHQLNQFLKLLKKAGASAFGRDEW